MPVAPLAPAVAGAAISKVVLTGKSTGGSSCTSSNQIFLYIYATAAAKGAVSVTGTAI